MLSVAASCLETFQNTHYYCIKNSDPYSCLTNNILDIGTHTVGLNKSLEELSSSYLARIKTQLTFQNSLFHNTGWLSFPFKSQEARRQQGPVCSHNLKRALIEYNPSIRPQISSVQIIMQTCANYPTRTAKLVFQKLNSGICI